MMATRNPKVAPKKSSVKAKRKEPAKEQAWTDTDDTETTKESGDLTEKAKDSSEQSDQSEQSIPQKGTGSIISVREAPDSEKDPLEGPSDLETNGVSEVNGISNGVGEQYPMTTDTEVPYGTETDSMGSVESGTKRRIKRNTVVPTDGEDTSAGRQTPESETRKDAWSAAEADISESDVPPSRPSSAAAMYRQALTKSRSRPATAPGKRPLPLPLERPMTAPSSALTNKNKAIKHDSNLHNDPVPSTSGVELEQQDKTLTKWSSDKQLALTNGEAKESWTMDIVKEGTRDGASTVSSCDLLAPPKISGEQNAYIPFFYARECIQKVMDDMKRMKANHIKVIDQIQDQYRLVEDEIQGKFNTFVIGLRTQYSDKVATFRHVIEIHREDTNSKQQYWQDTVKSLQAKNKKLLQDKRELMIKNRDEFNKLEEEKTKAIKDLTDMLDAKHVKYIAMLKDLKNERNKALELEERLQALEKQNKKLQEDFDSNKGTHEQELTVIKAKHEEQLQEQKQQLDLLLKEKDETLEKEKKEKEESIEEERKRLTEENQKYLADIEAKELELKSLREELEQLRSAGAIAVSADVVSTTLATSAAVETKELKEESQEEVKEKAEGETTEPKVITVTTTVHDTKEITKLTEEKNKLNEEKTKIEEELKKFEEEVTKVKEELENEKQNVIKLQEENSQLGKEKTRFEKHATENKQEIRELRLQCTSLREQLQGLLEATAQTKDDKETEEKLQAAENEKKALEEQQAKMKEEFEKWKEQFQAEHDGEEPSEDDRSEEIQQMMEKLKEEEERLKKAENTIAVMTMLKEGSVPETLPTVASGVSNERLEELEDRINKLEEERDSLEVKIETLQKEKDNEVEKLSKENDSLNEKNSSLEEKIAELNSENEELKVELSEARDSVPMSPPSPILAVEGEDVSEMSSRLVELQDELTKASQELEQEKAERLARMDELDALKQELEALKEGSAGDADNLRAELNSTKESLEAEIETKNKDLQEAKKRIEELQQKLMANVPVDTAKEMKSYQERLAVLQKEKETLTKENLTQKASVTTLTAKLETLNNNLERQKNNEKELQETNKKMRLEKEKEIKEAKEKAESKSKQKIEENNKMIQMLQKRIKELEASGVPHGEAKVDASSPRRKDSKAVDPEKLAKEKEKLLAQIDALKKAAQEDHKRIKALEKEAKDAAKNAKPAGPSAEDRAASKKMEKQLKDAQKNLEMEKKKFDKVKETLAKTEEEFKELKKEHDSLIAESKKDKADLAKLGVAAEEGLAAQEKVEELTKEVKSLRDENKTLSDNYNSERILRKKYYNMVEDMKGKIRVYCRARPLSKTENERGNHSVIKSPDEYSIVVSTSRGPKDFNFDQVFTPDHGQERVFEDTNNLIQSAVDGYNVCIFAYGQTGSGKTFTMIGDKEGNFPGIAPRAMEAIYRLIDENKKKFSFKVHTYMLELYNDKLIDLLAPTNKEPAKLDIKKDKKGLVFVTGSVMLEAATKDELWSIFERGSENRHVSSTKMNAESSRSHLILGIVIESTNLTSGAVVKGKLSLVDLAGSERAAKTGATPEQLKEAQSINKSLSALGDVISALSSDQSFIPYRNNKLTLLMQDSLGGNAKTLMFVNISPADYNTDETITSLTYASRVKLITNDAQKNSDNKEIARLKGIISKLKKGEAVEEDID